MIDPLAELFEHVGALPNVPLAPLTTWKVGGPARWFWRPASLGALCDVLGACHRAGTPVTFLGLGSNVLVADAGVPGLVVSPTRTLAAMEIDEDGVVFAQAGVQLPRLAHRAAEAGLTGFEGFLGIPGSVGGGVVMNAGLSAEGRREVGDILRSVTVVRPDGSVQRLKPATLQLGYRRSALQGSGACVFSALFEPAGRAPVETIRSTMAAHLAHRRATQPLRHPTAGSTFHTDAGAEHGAGWYLDRAGLKGVRRGGAQVSVKHANWVVNTGGATAADIEALMEVMQEGVRRRFGITLHREVRPLPARSGEQALASEGGAVAPAGRAPVESRDRW